MYNRTNLANNNPRSNFTLSINTALLLNKQACPFSPALSMSSAVHHQSEPAQCGTKLVARRHWAPAQLRIVREEVERIHAEGRRWRQQDYENLQQRVGDSPSVHNKVAAMRRQVAKNGTPSSPCAIASEQQVHAESPGETITPSQVSNHLYWCCGDFLNNSSCFVIADHNLHNNW